MTDRSNINLNAYATDGQNVGSGTGVFAGKSSVSVLDFKSITVLGGLTITGDSNTITISGGSGGGAAVWGTITGTLSGQTDLNDVLTGIASDLSTVSGQTDTNTSDIVTLSGKTIDSLQSDILEYDVANEKYTLYTGLTNGVKFYSNDPCPCPTGQTRIALNGVLGATALRVSTGNTSPTQLIGDIFWDSADHTVAIKQTDEVTQQIGQESYVFVKNNTGVGINNGDVVFINGADGDRPTVGLARAGSTDTNIVGAIVGLATESIADGETGFVTSFGLVKGLNTSGYAGGPGTTLYVSTTISGATQETKPSSPDYAIKLGLIAKKDGIDGRILISVTDQTDLTGVTVTANNGLTKTVNNIQLGGALTKDTLIQATGYGYGSLGTCCSYTATYNGTNVSRIISNSGNTTIIDVTNTGGASCQSIHLDLNNGNGIVVDETVDNIGFQYGGDYSTAGSTNPRWIPDNAHVTGYTNNNTYWDRTGTVIHPRNIGDDLQMDNSTCVTWAGSSAYLQGNSGGTDSLLLSANGFTSYMILCANNSIAMGATSSIILDTPEVTARSTTNSCQFRINPSGCRFYSYPQGMPLTVCSAPASISVDATALTLGGGEAFNTDYATAGGGINVCGGRSCCGTPGTVCIVAGEQICTGTYAPICVVGLPAKTNETDIVYADANGKLAAGPIVTGTTSYIPKIGTNELQDSFLFETGTTFSAIPICGLATCNPIGLHAMVFADNTQKLAFSYSTGSYSGPKISSESSDTLRFSGGYMIMTVNNHIKINTSGSANNEMIIDKLSHCSKEVVYTGGDGYGQSQIGIGVGLIGGAGRSTYNTDGGDVLLRPGAGDGTGATGQILLDGVTQACNVFFPKPYNCVDASCSGLPAPSGATGGMIYVADSVTMAWSDGTDWLKFNTCLPI